MNDLQEAADQNEDGGLLAKASDIIFDVVTGTSVPAPVRRNAIKAFGQLCTAVVDIPVAYLEGKAKEIRAATEERVKLISTSGDKIAAQVDVPIEYARAAVKRYGEKIVRERINIDNICDEAAKQIAEESESTSNQKATTETADGQKEINEDWINTFENIAGPVGTDEMQKHLSRILAGEIQRPGSFSIKTIKLVADLDASVLRLFRQFCSMTISLQIPLVPKMILDARVVTLAGPAAANSLQQYGLNFDRLNILHEYGLLISEFNSVFDYQMSIVRTTDGNRSIAMPFIYRGTPWGLVHTDDGEIAQNLNLNGVALSKGGKELLTVMELEPQGPYHEALIQYFKERNFELTPIDWPVVKTV